MKNLLFLLLVVLLNSCGGSNSPSSNPTTYISGVVVKGSVVEATVVAYQASDADFNQPLGSGKTDANGFYNIRLNQIYQGVIVVRVSGGVYIDESTGSTITLGISDTLTSAVSIDPSNTIIAITPLTDVAFRWARLAVERGDAVILDSTLTQSISTEVARKFRLEGIDIHRTIPQDISQATATDDASGQYGTILAAAFSQAITDQSTNNEVSFSDVSQIINNYVTSLVDKEFDSSEYLLALSSIQTNPRIKHNRDIINAISNTIVGISTPNIKVNSGLLTYTVTTDISTLTLINVGDAATTWSINPDLPAGLILDASGNISGIPATLTERISYVVTASNTTGSSSTTIDIYIVDFKPVIANIANQTFIKDMAIVPINFTNTGGRIISWSISPTLPSNLMQNNTTGQISGTALTTNTFTIYTVTANNSGGSATTSIGILINPATPNITGIVSHNYIQNKAIDKTYFISNAGEVSRWSINPALPSGLLFSSDATGSFITGIPSVITANTTYTITASNVTGTDTFSFNITVAQGPPELRSIPAKTYIRGSVITPFMAENISSGVDNWLITPNLPIGLTINATTGLISGSPSIVTALIAYTITASNDSGSGFTTFMLEVTPDLPNIADIDPQTLVTNQEINPIRFVNTGAAITNWSINPTLPSGLNFNNGIISGRPSANSPQTRYTITASNARGADTANIMIAVSNIVEVPNIANIEQAQFYALNTAIEPIGFINTGSVASQWSINTPLPTGLLLNSTTGIISGIPSIASSSTLYIVSARNSAGFATASITIGVGQATRNLSGEISVAVLIVADGDVNDPNAIYTPNNLPNTAQSINNFVTVHGFASESPASNYGLTGRFSQSADILDFYEVTLQQGQQIRLQISDYGGFPGYPNRFGYTYDLDLFLYNSNGFLVDFSNSINEFEQVTIPIDGQYYILINAFSGLSKYTLSILDAGQSGITQVKNMNFMIYQTVIQQEVTNTQGLGVQTHNNISLEQMPIANAQTRIAQAALKSDFLGELAQQNLESYDKYQTLQQIKRTSQRAGVHTAEPNYIYQPLRTPNDAHYGFQWHYPAINLPEAWDITTGETVNDGNDIIVAVIDSGVFLNHPDLEGKLVSGYDFISNISNAGDGNGIDSDPDDPGDGTLLNNSSWHGTHVAGTIGAKTNNGIGVAGVSWQAKIMPLRVLGREGGSGYDVAQALLYAAGLPNDSNTLPSRRADIINLSLGSNGSSSYEQTIYTQIRDAGVIIIAAAGNHNSSQRFYPASYDGVVSVSAVDYVRNKAPYSNFGDRVDVAAPGGDLAANLNGDTFGDGVLSTLINGSSGQRVGNYVFYQGTSMAAPHVAGVAALMKAVYPDMTPDQFDQYLSAGNLTDEAGSSGRDDIFGHGIINALKAVETARTIASGGTVPLSPANIIISPNSLNLGFSSDGVITVQNTGQTPATITGVNINVSWLSIAATPNIANGLGEYTLNINRDGLSDGNYTAVITFDIEGGNQTAISSNISIRVGGNVQDNSVTSLYILLLNDNFEIIQTVIPVKNGDVYQYRFTNVALGSYYILASSDIDNDGRYCQSGETCGGYPVVNELGLIAVTDRDINGRNFIINILSSSLNNSGNIIENTTENTP